MYKFHTYFFKCPLLPVCFFFQVILNLCLIFNKCNLKEVSLVTVYIRTFIARSQVLTVTSIKMAVSGMLHHVVSYSSFDGTWDMTLSYVVITSLESSLSSQLMSHQMRYRYWPMFQRSLLPLSSGTPVTLITDAVSSSEKSVNTYHNPWHNIPQENHLHT
jgi:hypothetical protein